MQNLAQREGTSLEGLPRIDNASEQARAAVHQLCWRPPDHVGRLHLPEDYSHHSCIDDSEDFDAQRDGGMTMRVHGCAKGRGLDLEPGAGQSGRMVTREGEGQLSPPSIRQVGRQGCGAWVRG